MNTACTAFKRYMISDYNKRSPVEERMSCFHVFKLRAFYSADYFIVFLACCFHCGNIKLLSHYIIFAVTLYKAVVETGTYAYCNVCGKCPCSRCPDNEIGILYICAHSGKLSKVICNAELYIY